MSKRKLAIVTGASRGLGLCIVGILAKSFDGDLYLTCRNNNVGEKIKEEFNNEGLVNVKFHQLDVTCKESVEKFLDFISKNYEGIDLLIHNAGVLILEKQYEIALKVMNTNFLSVLQFTEKSLGLMKKNSRILIISSTTGNWTLTNCSSELLNKLKSLNSFKDFREFALNYLEQVENGVTFNEEFEKHDYMHYEFSKVLLTLFSMHLNKTNEDITVTAICPGYMNTDMTGNDEVGIDPMVSAQSVVDICEKPESEIAGKFYRLDELVNPFKEDYKRTAYSGLVAKK